MADRPPASPPDLAADALRQVLEWIERRGLSRAELARRLGVSPAYVTKILGRRVNFTLDTLAGLAAVLDATVEIRLAERAPAGEAAAGSTQVEPRRERVRRPPEPAATVPSPGRDDAWRCW